MKVALIIGHKAESPGSVNASTDVTEFEFNKCLVQFVSSILNEKLKGTSLDGQLETEIVYREIYKDLPAKVNALNPDFIVSFHANAFNASASGTETLYYYKSSKGKSLALIMQNQMVNCLELPNRGVKPKSSEERGGYLLCYTNAPCVICEPFFLDHDEDLITVQAKLNKLANAYANGIMEYAISTLA